MSLEKVSVIKKSGEERFHTNGIPLDVYMKDIWSWSTSDILSNALG